MLKLGVAVVVRDASSTNPRFLVGRRKAALGRGRLAFPGGHVENSDPSFTYAGARELLEEVGIKVSFIKRGGGHDLFTNLDVATEDGLDKYATVFLLADYVSGGEWISEYRLKDLEDKHKFWEFVDYDRLTIMAYGEPDHNWIPITRLDLHRDLLLG